MRDLTGATLGRYEIKERLGTGGMASVYRAVQRPLGREVALKTLSPTLAEDEAFLRRFENEARVLATLDHPNILAIYDFDEQDGVAYLTMPLVKGGTLKDLLARGRMHPAVAYRYIKETADALQHAHEAGIIHRDLKPANVLIHADGRALLSDFGLARSADANLGLTTAGLALGTPGYMSPEQIMGREIDQRADVYAMGAMVFEMLTGQLPFKGGNAMEVAMATLSAPIPSACLLNPQLPDELDVFMASALAKDPAGRPPTMRSMVELMARIPQHRVGPPPVRSQ